MNNYDYIIVGSGASGLLMAYRMSLDPFFDDATILLLDKEKKTINDRTWCFWETPNGEWDDILVTSWKSIYFKSDIYSNKKSIAPYEYKMIRAARFYDKMWTQINSKKNISFIKEEIFSISQGDENAIVIAKNQKYTTKVLLNSVLFNKEYLQQTKYPVLQQHFVGLFIKTKTNLFDDSVATFMDFTIPQKGNTRFMYVLPYAKNEALFEYTLFSEKLLPYSDYQQAIDVYLKERGITDYEIIEKEQGSIPMTSYKFWEKNSKNIIHIGTAGGWSKASTGFTFKNIDRNSKRLIQYLKDGQSLEKFHKRTKFWFYDLLLLDILHKKNYLGAKIFGEMFRKNEPERILKFLDEETTILEEISMFSKMPKRLFIRALLNRLF